MEGFFNFGGTFNQAAGGQSHCRFNELQKYIHDDLPEDLMPENYRLHDETQIAIRFGFLLGQDVTNSAILNGRVTADELDQGFALFDGLAKRHSARPEKHH
ncbi:hypothetical protein [Caballeronia sp. LZ019]|uniref:hypothetical protein n=1 Tax=Caballeronia sp. LZ019 TaxID=3038555 RepID=UPI0028667616|nr:hypothetical protein [Caballeronia sp. LZ019]MDR5809533.1 hypothetical protein [Caballeronia sp. LZ019]